MKEKTAKRYFSAMLFLPLLLPLLVYSVEGSFIVGILIMSLGIAGIPYFIFAITILWRMRKYDLVKIKRLSYLLPLLFIPFFTIYSLIDFLIKKIANPSLTDFWGLIFVSAVYIILIGYSYVFVTHGVYFVADKIIDSKGVD